jgi:hypothetical protein
MWQQVMVKGHQPGAIVGTDGSDVVMKIVGAHDVMLQPARVARLMYDGCSHCGPFS